MIRKEYLEDEIAKCKNIMGSSNDHDDSLEAYHECNVYEKLLDILTSSSRIIERPYHEVKSKVKRLTEAIENAVPVINTENENDMEMYNAMHDLKIYMASGISQVTDRERLLTDFIEWFDPDDNQMLKNDIELFLEQNDSGQL